MENDSIQMERGIHQWYGGIPGKPEMNLASKGGIRWEKLPKSRHLAGIKDRGRGCVFLNGSPEIIELIRRRLQEKMFVEIRVKNSIRNTVTRKLSLFSG